MDNIFKVKGKANIGDLIISILIAEAIGFIAGAFTMGDMNTYMELEKPIFSPPGFVFPIVWGILYALMGIAAYRIWRLKKEGVYIGSALVFYVIQLILNFLWPFIFFKFNLYGLAFIEIIILLIFIIITTVKFFRLDKLAGILMLPYVLWVSFAAVLNYFIWMLNEM